MDTHMRRINVNDTFRIGDVVMSLLAELFDLILAGRKHLGEQIDLLLARLLKDHPEILGLLQTSANIVGRRLQLAA